MAESKQKVLIAMSGGVDSSVAAALLIEQGYAVRGLILRLWSADDSTLGFEQSRERALQVACQLGITLDVVDARKEFLAATVGYFVESQKMGLTPNPCYKCNRDIKWKMLSDFASKMKIGTISTGHYARLIKTDDGTVELRKALDSTKDQSYVLAGLSQLQLQQANFPLGDRRKSEIREIAHRYNFENFDQEDSQDLCFLAGMKQKDFFERYAPELNNPGHIKKLTGEVIGSHTGLHNYTIGQRKGLGSGNKEPLYVLDKDVDKNELIVGIATELGSKQVTVRSLNWMNGKQPLFPVDCSVKIRYRAAPVSCSIFQHSKDEVLIKFNQSIRDATPGQIAVFYNDDLVIGSGVIHRIIGVGE